MILRNYEILFIDVKATTQHQIKVFAYSDLHALGIALDEISAGEWSICKGRRVEIRCI